MIYLFTDGESITHALIHHYGLNRSDRESDFWVFSNRENEIELMLPETGGVAQAVRSVCAKGSVGPGDFLLAIRTCADEWIYPKEVCLCNKISDPSSGDVFYPDLLYQHSFWECGAEDGKIAEIYREGACFFRPHQMTFLMAAKTESADHDLQICGVADYIDRLRGLGAVKQPCTDQLAEEEFVEKLCEDLHCSQTMRIILIQHIRYFALSGMDYRGVTDKMYADGKLPCRDKREGKVRFEELTERLLQKLL